MKSASPNTILKNTLKISINVVIEKDSTGFVAYCPELKGLIADGKDEIEVINNFEDAAKAYIKSLLKHGDPLPLCSTINVEEIPKDSVRKNIQIPLPIFLNDSSSLTSL